MAISTRYPNLPGAPKESYGLSDEKVAPDTKKIKEAYDKKIAWYHKKLMSLNSDRDRLIKKIKLGKSLSMDQFMKDAEKIGIDEMNHQTIIEMLGKQYEQWFGEKAESITVYEQERASKQYLDGELL